MAAAAMRNSIKIAADALKKEESDVELRKYAKAIALVEEQTTYMLASTGQERDGYLLSARERAESEAKRLEREKEERESKEVVDMNGLPVQYVGKLNDALLARVRSAARCLRMINAKVLDKCAKGSCMSDVDYKRLLEHFRREGKAALRLIQNKKWF